MPIDNRPLSNPVPEDGEESTTETSGQPVHSEGLAPFEVAAQVGAGEAEEGVNAPLNPASPAPDGGAGTAAASPPKGNA